MKIGVLVTYFHPFRDGTENQCLSWSSEIAHKHEIHIFTSDRRDNEILKDKYEEYNHLHIHRYKTLFRYKYYLCWNWKLIIDLLKADLDVLHIHSLGFIQQDLAVLLLKILKPKLGIVNFPHGPFLANENYSKPVKLIREVYRVIEKYVVNRFYDRIIDCNGNQKITWMPNYFPNLDRIKYCPDGIPKDRFAKVDSRDFAEKYNLKNKFVIVHLGRLVKYKGQEQTLKVLPDILKKHKNVIYMIIGQDRGYKSELENLAKQLGVDDNVIFTGEISEEDKLKAFDSAKVVVFTSAPGTEAFGIVTLEGMARKCAAISSEIIGGNTAVLHNETGFVYRYDNLDALKSYISQLIEDKKLLKRFQEASYERARQFVNEDIVWKYLEPIYLEACAK
ncbi:MAG: glycosyltransferase family 4 protein [Nanoarchaeota archaeon]